MSRYSMGIDFGTLSGRAIIVDIDTGAEIATSVMEYAHGVMSDKFLDGSRLPADFALQHPQDYIDALCFTVKDCIEKSGVDASDIIGIGVDFTASTVLSVDECGVPLCFYDEYKNNPHAYVKLWKHHAAQKEADEINNLARAENAAWLGKYGGTVSCEWLLPKVLNTVREDEELYNKTFRFIEAGDWLVWQLTGKESHSAAMACFKALYYDGAYPDKEFLRKLDVRIENIVGDKISDNIIKMSEIAGYVSKEASEATGLKEGTPVMPAFIDAHAALPALGVIRKGALLMIIGTSCCHIMLSDKESCVPGISGVVRDGIVDGLYAYEAGQACVGDSFDWFVKNCVPYSYYAEAEKQGVNIHKYLRSKAEKLSPGSNGIIALDWWNGNRTPYVNGNLSGVIAGLTINTAPEQIYRALIEATAYGTKRIIEIYEENGINIDVLYAAGGIADKDAMLMQIYADVTGREIRLSGTSQACAYGSAVLGAVNENGYKSLEEACDKMKKIKEISYKPDKENTEKYAVLYEEYKKLSEYFADGRNNLMEQLSKVR